MSTDTPPPVQAKTPLPGWARLLVSIFIASLIGCLITIGVASFTFANWQKEVRDPERIGKLAVSEFHLQQLPPKFQYMMGYSLPGIAIVGISYDKDQTTFVMMRAQNTHGLTDPNLPEILPHDPVQPGSTLDNTKLGEDVVAGHKMAYMVGDLAAGGKIKQFRGAYLVDNNKTVVRITGTTGESTYNMDATKQLIQCIK